MSYILNYRKSHRIENFAGNLEQLNAAYREGSDDVKAEIRRQFDRIVDGLVMPNGVKKTTYSDRLSHLIAEILTAVRLPQQELRVLDLPSSAGAPSLQISELLQENYRITSYVLGDLYHCILHDARRCCIFDEHGNLLQVAFRKFYFSIYKGHKCGDQYTFISTCLLLPHSIAAWCLKKLYRFDPGAECRRLLVVHPEVEQHLGRGIYHLEVMDIFQPIPDNYDVILSFNLLQKNYFPPAVIAAGIANLASSLTEGGLLVLGDTDSFWALQKQDGSLITRLRKGDF
ncbi:MAG: hypothetical protein C3F11_05945 [Methylocystaceae bacterium]|nr:MAG: hypothetical protein C3F11_05945 [Methylocystaceae bacterium]